MRSSYIFGLFGLWICGTMVCKGLELPDTSGIDREFIGNHSVDQFFSLWIVFNNDDGVQISGIRLVKILKPNGKFIFL